MIRVHLLVACAVSVGLSAYAAEDAIVTDRPDYVESSAVVGPGRFQIETSVAFDRDEQNGDKTVRRSTPTLLRIGVSDTVELRFETDGALRLSTQEGGVTTHTYGQADLSVGLKWHVTDGDEALGRPGVAWLLHVDTNSGSAAFRGQGWRPSLRMTAEWELPNDYSLGVMPGVFVERNETGSSYLGGIAAVVLGKSFTDKTRGFLELSGQQLARPRNGGNVVTADIGAAYLLTPSAQLDTAASWGLSKEAPDFSWTVGLSLLF